MYSRDVIINWYLPPGTVSVTKSTLQQIKQVLVTRYEYHTQTTVKTTQASCAIVIMWIMERELSITLLTLMLHMYFHPHYTFFIDFYITDITSTYVLSTQAINT